MAHLMAPLSDGEQPTNSDTTSMDACFLPLSCSRVQGLGFRQHGRLLHAALLQQGCRIDPQISPKYPTHGRSHRWPRVLFSLEMHYAVHQPRPRPASRGKRAGTSAPQHTSACGP